MMVELKCGPTWRQERAERTAIKEKQKADKKEAKIKAKIADQEKQQPDTSEPSPSPAS